MFKIRDDPRFTKIGRWLARTGLDELPQIINVLKGEMGLAGPRPLPPNEERRIPAKWRFKRRSVRPGVTSSWVINCAHALKFREWMELDMKDIDNKSWRHNAAILIKTMAMCTKNLLPII